ncbi:MAG: M1 family metallopeptidase [Christensenellales bacterium]
MKSLKQKNINKSTTHSKKFWLFVGVGLAFVLSLSFLLCLCFKNHNTNFVAVFSKNVNEYSLDVSIDCEEKTLNVLQKTKFINQTEGVSLKSVYFHIYPKAFCEGVVNKPVSSINEAKAYPNGISYGDFELLKLSVENKEVSPRYLNADKDILVVDLFDELFPKKSVDILFEYKIKLPNINHRFGYGENTINLGNFYLIACVYDENEGFFANSYHYNGDPFYSEMANYDVSVTYNKNFVLASTGTMKNEDENENFKTTHITAKAVRDFAMILSDKFKKISAKVENVNVNYFYYQDENPEKSLMTCQNSLKTFSSLFAKYPYETLNVCESNFVYGGMEYPNLVFISDSLENYDDQTYTIVHEIAHQWWYNMVGNNEYKYGFLDEGLTEYSTYMFFDENPDYGLNSKEMIKNTTNSYLLFLDVYKEVFTKVDTSMLRSLNEFGTEPEYIYLSYVKGVLMFDNLKDIVGKTNFIKSLKFYFSQNQGKNAVPENLIYAFSRVCKKDLESYFNSWFNGSVVIESM